MRWVLLTVALVMAGPAIADWQYTRWGMSPAQVIEAGGGIKPWRRPEADTSTGIIQLVGSYQSSGIGFRAEFKFSQNRLTRVVLTPKSADCNSLKALMARTYGRIPGQGGTIIQTWRDANSGNFVAYTHFQLTSFCQVDYSQLQSAGSRGGM
ncbi:hypothetical protein [Enterovirga rhinocerotis]|uniref:hypothetical protein n=1 Tax=Enterovirga rhinocerotis TaxID=1339210 RepID=UPI00105C91D7|nr:hypothetical protein [Enterovirga rhinocerotis]